MTINEKELTKFVESYQGDKSNLITFAFEIAKFVNNGYKTNVVYDPESGYYKYTFDKPYILTDGSTQISLNNKSFQIDMYNYLDRNGDGVFLDAEFVDDGKAIVFEPDGWLREFNIKYWMDFIANKMNNGSFNFDDFYNTFKDSSKEEDEEEEFDIEPFWIEMVK